MRRLSGTWRALQGAVRYSARDGAAELDIIEVIAKLLKTSSLMQVGSSAKRGSDTKHGFFPVTHPSVGSAALDPAYVKICCLERQLQNEAQVGYTRALRPGTTQLAPNSAIASIVKKYLPSPWFASGGKLSLR
jgi:hypothetical protein